MKNLNNSIASGKSILTLFLLSLLMITNGLSQDKVYRLNGTVVDAKVMEVTETNVSFKRFNNPDGPTYTELRTSLIKITYETGGEDIFNANAAKKLDQLIDSDPNSIKRLDLSTSHHIYVEILGIGGILSANYEGKIATLANEHVFIYARGGAGFSNKGIYIPHGISLGVGSMKHQFEFGVNGTTIARATERDALSFIHGDGQLRYTFGPSFGYRLQSESGFFMKASIPMIISKDIYNFEGGSGATWGMTPWTSLALGFGF